MLNKPQNKHIENPVYLIDSIINHHRPHHRRRPHPHPHPCPRPHPHRRRRRHHATLLTYQPTSTNETTFQAPDIFGWGPASDWGWLGVKTHSSKMTRSSVQSLGLRTRSTGAHWCRPPWQKRRKRRATRIANQTRRNTRLLKPHWHKTIDANPSKRRCIKFLLHHWTIAVPNPPSLLSQALHQPWHSRSIYFISPPSRMRERSLFHHTVNLCELCAHGSKKG